MSPDLLSSLRGIQPPTPARLHVSSVAEGGLKHADLLVHMKMPPPCGIMCYFALLKNQKLWLRECILLI